VGRRVSAAERRAKAEIEIAIMHEKIRVEEEARLQTKAEREAKEQEEIDRIRDAARQIIAEERIRWQKEFPGRRFTEEEQDMTYWENWRTYIGEIAFLHKRFRDRGAKEQENQQEREAQEAAREEARREQEKREAEAERERQTKEEEQNRLRKEIRDRTEALRKESKEAYER
jgi:hypothetical protein